MTAKSCRSQLVLECHLEALQSGWRFLADGIGSDIHKLDGLPCWDERTCSCCIHIERVRVFEAMRGPSERRAAGTDSLPRVRSALKQNSATKVSCLSLWRPKLVPCKENLSRASS